MKTPNWKPVTLAIKDGFKIVLEFEEEIDLNPKKHFIEDCGWPSIEYSTISNFYWFVAKITAYKGVIECGSSYLGACCYQNKKDVVNPIKGGFKLDNCLGGYAPQMVEEAVEEAKRNLSEI